MRPIGHGAVMTFGNTSWAVCPFYVFRKQLLLGIAFVAIVIGLCGCASDKYVTARRIPSNPLQGPLQLLSRNGPQATPRTEQLLRRYDLTGGADETLMELQKEIDREPEPEKLYAFAELAYVYGKKAEALKNRARALDLYGASVAHAYWYLFDDRFDRFRNPYDPQFRGACDLYNGALEAAMRIVAKRGELKPGATYNIDTGQTKFSVAIVPRGRWKTEDFKSLEFVNDFEVKGLTNRHHTYGLGVPMIAVWRQQAHDTSESQYYPKGLSFPVTAFLRVMQPPQGSTNGVRHCVLELHDTVPVKDIEVCNRRVPLETDLTTPLAYFLGSRELKERRRIDIATLALFKPELAESLQGIYMLEPYEPDKIPVMMVHGLWSSPVTWMEMFNDLRSFPEIREQYQFWFYLYPTGQPFWVSARQMRKDLAQVRETLDHARVSPALDQMVLVGHSMGGLVSRMQVVNSGEDFWQIVSDRPFEELNADDETRERVAGTVFFQPNPSIRRVVTIGTPHRGSEFANEYTRWIGRNLIRLPEMMVNATRKLNRDNPGFFRDTDFLTVKTSIDSLSPDSPVLPVLLNAEQAPWTKHHNIVGLVEQSGIMSRIASDGDGVVEFASAHVESADSEVVVGSDHVSLHRHPRSILEVRRVLLEHRAQALAEMGRLPHALPASYLGPVEACAPISQQEHDRVVNVVQEFLGYPPNARFQLSRYEDGYHVVAYFVGEDPAARTLAGSRLLFVSHDGRVLRYEAGY
jgi:hypothetical protein